MVESPNRSNSKYVSHKPYIAERSLVPPLIASMIGPLLQKMTMAIRYPMKNGELAAILSPTIHSLQDDLFAKRNELKFNALTLVNKLHNLFFITA